MKNNLWKPAEAKALENSLRRRKQLTELGIFLLKLLFLVTLVFLISYFVVTPHLRSVIKDVIKGPSNELPDKDASISSPIKTPKSEITLETAIISKTKSLIPVESSYVLKTNGCRIPDQNPFDQSTKLLIPKPYKIECETNASLPLIESNSSAIFVNEKARSFYCNDKDEIDCCWRFFKRSRIRENFVLYSKCFPFESESVRIDREFIKVECKLPNNTVYQDFFAFLPEKFRIEQRSYEILQSNTTSKNKKLSVIVIGMNSVSRLNLHRAMPRTVEALEKIGAVEMLGYHKVGYDIYENLVPLLTGLSYKKFEKLCWKNRDMVFDKCPFVWKDYQEKGYRTIFAEDTSTMTAFNHLKPGFKIQPTDYYLRPFWFASEPTIGNAKKCNTYMCSGTRYTFNRLLNYTSLVAKTFVDKLYFGVFWESSLTHDFIQDAQLGDESYYDLLMNLHDNNLLNNTAFIFTSDHGMRYNSFRQTYQGRIEENLPFLYIQMPEWWKKENPSAWESLKKNAERLTTPYDLYQTFQDILDPDHLGQEKENRDSVNNTGFSLFKPITEERTCESANIPEHWCTCHHRHEISSDTLKLVKISNFLVDEINKQIADQPQCAELKLSSLIDVKVMNDANYQRDLIVKDGYQLLRNEKKWNWTEYSVFLQTEPGNGIFEGQIRYDVNEELQLMGYVSRLNDYANQSSCVRDFSKRYYCTCLPENNLVLNV